MLKDEYQQAAQNNTAKLFKAVSVRVGSVLLKSKADGFIDGFSNEEKGGTGKKARHSAFYIKGTEFDIRHAGATKTVKGDFSIYLSAEKTGPVQLTIFPVGAKARSILSTITGPDRMAEFKGPHTITETTSRDFKLLLGVLEGTLSRSRAKFQTAAEKIKPPSPEI